MLILSQARLKLEYTAPLPWPSGMKNMIYSHVRGQNYIQPIQKIFSPNQGTEPTKSSAWTKVEYTWTEYQVMPIHPHTRLVGEHTKPE